MLLVIPHQYSEPWPIGWFLLADCWHNQRTGRGVRAESKDPWISSEARGGPEESQEPKELDVIIIDDEEGNEKVPAVRVDPDVSGSGE